MYICICITYLYTYLFIYVFIYVFTYVYVHAYNLSVRSSQPRCSRIHRHPTSNEFKLRNTWDSHGSYVWPNKKESKETHLLSSIRNYYHLLTSIMIYYHLLSSIIIYCGPLSSIIIDFHLLSSISNGSPRFFPCVPSFFQAHLVTLPLEPGIQLWLRRASDGHRGSHTMTHKDQTVAARVLLLLPQLENPRGWHGDMVMTWCWHGDDMVMTWWMVDDGRW